MKRVRRDLERWQPPVPVWPVAVFQCRRCQASLTPSLALMADATGLSQREGTSLVPPGRYWRVPAGHDFAGAFAVALTDVAAVGYHYDTRRLIGCCGPSGCHGRNRLCRCEYEVGTERSDCNWPHAVYLDPSQVRAVAPDAVQDSKSIE